MKARSLIIAVLCSFMGVVNTFAQNLFNENTSASLTGVWQMCFYSSSLPALPGDLKPSNSLKILGESGEFTNVVMMPTGAIIIGSGTYTQNNEIYNTDVRREPHIKIMCSPLIFFRAAGTFQPASVFTEAPVAASWYITQ